MLNEHSNNYVRTHKNTAYNENDKIEEHVEVGLVYGLIVDILEKKNCCKLLLQCSERIRIRC